MAFTRSRPAAVVVSLGSAVALAGLSGCSGDDSTATPAASTRSYGIVVQRGIAGLRLGMSSREVRDVLAAPDAVRRQSESETGRTIVEWVYRAERVTADFRRHGSGALRLTTVTTRSKRYRTAEGLGVGSSEATVKDRLDRVDCAAADPGTRWCTVGSTRNGTTQTVFTLRRGRVVEVTVTRVFS